MKPLSKVIISNGANDVCLLDLVTDLGGNKPTVLIGARNIHGHIKRTKGVKSGFIATTLDGFNPLKSGQLFQIQGGKLMGMRTEIEEFQSPKIGSVVSNQGGISRRFHLSWMFQSPKIGSVVSNVAKATLEVG